MLLNHDVNDPIYIIGQSVLADEYDWLLSRNDPCEIIHVDHDRFDSVPQGSQCMLGFGNIEYRKKFITQNPVDRYRWPTFVHPQALVEDHSLLGRGCIVYPFSYVCFRTHIGDFNVLAPHCGITHETHTGTNVYFSPNVTVGGRSHIGDHVFFGYSSTISSYVNISSDTKFLMNSSIHRDVIEPGVYFGNRRATGDTKI